MLRFSKHRQALGETPGGMNRGSPPSVESPDIRWCPFSGGGVFGPSPFMIFIDSLTFDMVIKKR